MNANQVKGALKDAAGKIRRTAGEITGNRGQQVQGAAVQTARQPGARHAPLQFVSGRLFSADIHRIYEDIPHPVWLANGTRGDFRALGRLHFQSPWQPTVFDTGALPYFEKPGQFAAVFDTFLRVALRPVVAGSPPRHSGMGSTVRIEPVLR